MTVDDTLILDTTCRGILKITFNRPSRLNALTGEMVDNLIVSLRNAATDEACRAVIITGAEQSFCSGQDMKAAAARAENGRTGPVERMRWQRHFAEMARAMRDMPQPVIAAVNGVAAGAGMAISLAADIRIVSDDARFLIASVKIGLSAGESGISYHLPRWIGAGRAFEVMLSGRAIGADEAVLTGLAVRKVSREALASAAIDQALAIMANSPFAVAETKRLMWRNLDAPNLDAALALENPTQILASLTGDYGEALSAFAEKRPPQFIGR